MNIEIASTSLEIFGHKGRVLKVAFDAPLDEPSVRRHRKELRAVQKSSAGHERDLQFVLLELDQVLSPFFVTDKHTHPVRVLNGLTLTSIVARKAPCHLGGLGLDVYNRVLRELQQENAFRQPIEGYSGLEALFADKVVDVIETVAQDRKKRGTLEQVDQVFYTLSTGRKLDVTVCISDASTSAAHRLLQLERKITEIEPVFVKWEGSVPNLSGVTIKGIALALGDNDATTNGAVDFTVLAKEATAYRRKLGLGGRDVGASSAEFHVRIFRAIGLTSADAAELSAETFKALVQTAIDLHAFEPVAKAA